LQPWIDVSAEVTTARPEIAMVVNKHDETRRGECLSETLKAVFPGPSKAMGHGDSGVNSIPIGQEQPGAEFDSPFCGNPHIKLQNHFSLLADQQFSSAQSPSIWMSADAWGILTEEAAVRSSLVGIPSAVAMRACASNKLTSMPPIRFVPCRHRRIARCP
jgi:hypothetical protein